MIGCYVMGRKCVGTYVRTAHSMLRRHPEHGTKTDILILIAPKPRTDSLFAWMDAQIFHSFPFALSSYDVHHSGVVPLLYAPTLFKALHQRQLSIGHLPLVLPSVANDQCQTRLTLRRVTVTATEKVRLSWGANRKNGDKTATNIRFRILSYLGI